MKYLSLYTKNRIRQMAKQGKQVSEIMEVTGFTYEQVKTTIYGFDRDTKRPASKYAKRYKENTAQKD